MSTTRTRRPHADSDDDEEAPARRKRTAKRSSRAPGRAKRSPLLVRLWALVPSRIKFGLFLIVLAGVLLWWNWEPAYETSNAVIEFLGLGLPALGLWAVALAIALRRSGRAAFRHSHRWLAIIVFGIGVLAFAAKVDFSPLASGLGDAIVDGSAFLAFWKVVGIFLLGAALVTPRAAFDMTKKSFRFAALPAGRRARRGIAAVRAVVQHRRALAAPAPVPALEERRTVPVLRGGVARPVVVEDDRVEGPDSVDEDLFEAEDFADDAEDDDEDAPKVIPIIRASARTVAQSTPPQAADPTGPLPTEVAPEDAAATPPWETAGGEPHAAPVFVKAGPEDIRAEDLDDIRAKAPVGGWRLPPIDLLEHGDWGATDDTEHIREARKIEQALADHGIDAEVVEIRPGPTVTQYGLKPGWQRKFRDVAQKDALGQSLFTSEGRPLIRKEEISKTRVKVDRIANLEKDLALTLEAVIRVEAPVPGTGIVGIEVPNHVKQVVMHRDILESEAFRKAAEKSPLAVPIGVRPGGEVIIGDLARMPHLLIGGSTGSGKSVFINTILISLLLQATPEQVKMILVDPKRVELSRYADLPHLAAPVLLDPEDVVNALKWAISQMEERLTILSNAGSRDVQSYNKTHGKNKPLPYLLIVIDELADLMMVTGKAVEKHIARLAQMGRATGIHLVVATQRPSVDVITGLIKNNLPTRVSFAVTSQVDSRTIMDIGGAEKLLGRGDLIYHSQDSKGHLRVQGAYISEEETKAITDFWRTQSPDYKPAPLPNMDASDADPDELPASRGGPGGKQDALLEQGRELAAVYGSRLSTSLLQRKLGIGYPRTARLKDQLTREGLVTNNDG